jgi:sigma-E factor negative regulatory protein RseC
MIEQTAHVVALEGEFAWVQTARKNSCQHCHTHGCRNAVLGRLLGERTHRMRVLNHAAAEVGEKVLIGLREEALVRGSLAVYLVPLLGLLILAPVGEAIAAYWEMGEGLSVLSGLGGLAMGSLWVRAYSIKTQRDMRYQPIILHVLQANQIAIDN